MSCSIPLLPAGEVLAGLRGGYLAKIVLVVASFDWLEVALSSYCSQIVEVEALSGRSLDLEYP